jgi:hypothetical protein
MTRHIWPNFALAFIVTFAVPAVRADIVYSLDIDNCTNGCLNGTNGGTVTLQQVTANSVSITVQLLSGLAFQGSNYTTPPSNNSSTFAFNADIANLQISNLTTGWVPQSGVPVSNVNSDGFGHFDYQVTCPLSVCPSGQISNPTSVSFTITNTAALALTDFAVVSTHGTPSFFAADVVSNRNGSITTGYIGSDDIPGTRSVPDGGTTAILLSFALAGLGLVSRRMK